MTTREDRETPAAGVPADLRAALAARGGGARLDLLLERPESVPALPADDLFHAIVDVGLADAHEIVRLASPEQFRTFLDLAGWRGDDFVPALALPWLRAARPPSLSGEEEESKFREKLRALDPEVMGLVLRATVRVHDLEEDPDPEPETDRFARTPEGRFLVEFLPEGADGVLARRLVDDMYAEDPFRAGRLLSAARHDLESDLAESALRWRTGRLADLGFPSFEEALSWFARPPARPAERPAGLPDRPPGFWLAAHRGEALLDRAAALLPASARARFEAEALQAANAVLVAERVDPSDADEVRGALAAARALLEMGLEATAPSEAEGASAVLAATPLKRVFQAGFGRLLELRWRAERLARRLAPLGLRLDPPLGEALAALRLRRPRYHPGIAAPRPEWGSPATAAPTARPFRDTSEVRAAEGALDEAEGLVDLAGRLGLAPAAPAPGGTVAAAYLTALANERLGRPFAPDPLAAAELLAAARALSPLGDPRLDAAGSAGALLATLARNRAAELGPLLSGERYAPGAVTALLVGP